MEPLTTSRRVIAKSRYDSISSYLSNSPNNKPEYEDIPLEMDEDIYAELRYGGFDERLARHFGHLFIRDPLVVYEELLEQVHHAFAGQGVLDGQRITKMHTRDSDLFLCPVFFPPLLLWEPFTCIVERTGKEKHRQKGKAIVAMK